MRFNVGNTKKLFCFLRKRIAEYRFRTFPLIVLSKTIAKYAQTDCNQTNLHWRKYYLNDVRTWTKFKIFSSVFVVFIFI